MCSGPTRRSSGNRPQRDELEQKGARGVDLFRRAQSIAAVAALDGTRVVMPRFTHDGPRAEVDLGGRKVELHSWGMARARGDQVVFLPGECILFAGDLIEGRMFPTFPWTHSTTWRLTARGGWAS